METVSRRSTPRQAGDSVVGASWVCAGIALFLVLYLHLLPALFAGLVVFELVHTLAPLLQKRFTGQRSRLFAVAALAIFTIGVLILFIAGTIAFFRSDTGSLPALADKVRHILTDARTRLPPWLVENLPGNPDELKVMALGWLDQHPKEVQLVGKEATHSFVHVLVGMVIGALVSLHEGQPVLKMRPFARALLERVVRFSEAFRKIIFAQVRISVLNTSLSAIFLLVALPLFGVHLPLAKTLIAITFLAGLLPIVGNLISNSLIVIVSLSVSVYAALAALGFLVVVHKLEYFLNARIVGSQIHAHAWELLLAMIAMEAAFGIAGLVAAPFFYAYIKAELSAANLI
ncbi:MAG: AI-2E family transporter [Chthoniobacterales bacterium]